MSWSLSNTESLLLTQKVLDDMISKIPILSFVKEVDWPQETPGYVSDAMREFTYDTKGVSTTGANPTDKVSRRFTYGKSLKAYGSSFKSLNQAKSFLDLNAIRNSADELDETLNDFLTSLAMISSISVTSKIKFFKLAAIIFVMCDYLYGESSYRPHYGIDYLRACAILRRCLNRHPEHTAIVDFSDTDENYSNSRLSVISNNGASSLEHPFLHAMKRLINGNPIYNSTWVLYSDRIVDDSMGFYYNNEYRGYDSHALYHTYPNGIGSKSYSIHDICTKGIERYADKVIEFNNLSKFDLITLAKNECTDDELVSFILPYDCLLSDGLTADQDLGYSVFDMQYILDDEYKRSLKYLLFNYISSRFIENDNELGCVTARFTIDIPTAGERPKSNRANQAKVVDNWSARAMSSHMVIDEPERQSFVVKQTRTKHGNDFYKFILTGLSAPETPIRLLCNQLISMMISSVGTFTGLEPPYNEYSYYTAAYSQVEAVRTRRAEPGVAVKCVLIRNALIEATRNGRSIFEQTRSSYVIPEKSHMQYTTQARPTGYSYRPHLVRGQECMFGGRYGRVGLFVPSIIVGDHSEIGNVKRSLVEFQRNWLDTYAGEADLKIERWAKIHLSTADYHVTGIDVVAVW